MGSSFRDLTVWRKAKKLSLDVYKVTKKFPRDEMFGLTSQLRRAAVGIPSNISEGHQHRTRSYRRYVTMALGCEAECETQLELVRRLRLVRDQDIGPVIQQAAELGRVLHGLRRSLKVPPQASDRQRFRSPRSDP